MGQLAAWYRLSLPAKVISITGSAGKTSTREIVAQVLGAKMAVHCAKKSYNNNIGLPLTLFGAEDHHQVVVTELGTNAPGEICHLSQIAQPDIALITNIHPAHLEGFASLDGIIREKASIAEGLRPDGTFWINGDFPDLCRYCISNNYSYRTFGFSEGCEIQGIDPVVTEVGGKVTIDGVEISIPLAGKANLANSIAAWAICQQFMDLSAFAGAIATVEPVSMRLQVEQVGSIRLINDYYNANPGSMSNALDYFRTFESGRRVFVCGSMAELGSDSPRFHNQLGRQAVDSGVEVLLAAGPFARQVVDAALAEGHRSVTAHAYESTGELVDSLHLFIRPDDIVLVKGSRSAKMELAADAVRTLAGR
jgi:UDP-N-acetylmuramoyl-tripeptide--D-alanyl-D-alanine ligase